MRNRKISEHELEHLKKVYPTGTRVELVFMNCSKDELNNCFNTKDMFICSSLLFSVLKELLADHTTQANIIWATNAYEKYGVSYRKETQMTAEQVLKLINDGIMLPRVQKSRAMQLSRTRNRAEVFTPPWICNKMNNICDEQWFLRKNVFNTENSDNSWTVNENKIQFDETQFEGSAEWIRYVSSRRIEITCGEAPYLVSRYDVTLGDYLKIKNRIGILDRKLRVVGENTENESDWLKWVVRAYEACYGFEFQGDNLFFARVNMLQTFIDYYYERFKKMPPMAKIEQIANIISWNIWQMDALKDTVPFGVSTKGCKIKDWCNKIVFEYSRLKEKPNINYDYAVGNPPYQKSRQGDSNTALPVYNYYMDITYAISEKAVLIHPARFLFNVGGTQKAWNTKMLSDKHFKIICYEQNSNQIFKNTDIKGGVVISYRDIFSDYEGIGTFTVYSELDSIIRKTSTFVQESSLADICFVATKFNISELGKDFPEYKGHERRMSSNVLAFNCFYDSIKTKLDVGIYGIYNKQRALRYISEKYVDKLDLHILKYKIVMPKANGNGAFGSTITMPEILAPRTGFTHTFLGMGAFDNITEANNALKYIKTKFARTLLSVLKVTQDLNANKWKYVPLQDFTSASDIDWSISVAEIDRQLYKKYGLSQNEINFIETHVKKME